MFKIKRLYSFILQTFLPVFAMTFAICLFIFLMQFLWRFVEDLVGKGLEFSVIAELFIYAALTLIPESLPLAILLASLITFGNLGEKLELLAIKAAGVSLFKTMFPLIIFVSFICVGSFFYQNEARPRINVKMRALLFSVKRAKPELDIPEGSFYGGIDKYSIYVKKKNKETGMLYNTMIYETKDGFDNLAVFVCDSALMKVPESKDHLRLTLYSGQRFANFRDAGVGNNTPRNSEFVPYGRENFKEKVILIPFSTDFDRMDEANLEGTQIAKNIYQLDRAIDSLGVKVDSLNIGDRKNIYLQLYPKPIRLTDEAISIDRSGETKSASAGDESQIQLPFDSILNTFSSNEQLSFVSSAVNRAESAKNGYIFDSTVKMELQKKIRIHRIEWHTKFTLSLACLIFFLIGAPLGAIIRKGGLGLPVVISVILFIIYYVINNTGYKMARDGLWEQWQGVWLSSAALLPLGIFLTYKAINDSALFNSEAYSKKLRKILNIKTQNKLSIHLEFLDVQSCPSLQELNVGEVEQTDSLLKSDDNTLRDIIQNYEKYNFDQVIQSIAISILKDRDVKTADITIAEIDTEEVKFCTKAFNKNTLLGNIAWLSTLFFWIIYLIFNIMFFKPIAIISTIAFAVLYVRNNLIHTDFRHNIANTYLEKTLLKSKTFLSKWKIDKIITFLLFPYMTHKMKKVMENVLNQIK